MSRSHITQSVAWRGVKMLTLRLVTGGLFIDYVIKIFD